MNDCTLKIICLKGNKLEANRNINMENKEHESVLMILLHCHPRVLLLDGLQQAI